MILALALLLAAADPAAAYRDLDRARVSGDEARARIATAVQALEDFAMPRSATVLLAALASDPAQSEGVRAAAREKLASRAGADPALAQILIAEQGDPGKLPAAVAVAIARGHLESALRIAPLEEGVAFEALPQQASAEPVSASGAVQPLEKDLAAEMGLA
ncbi:MAG: hypothetical protein ACXWLR_11720, partial [Myxococcales bacterium]